MTSGLLGRQHKQVSTTLEAWIPATAKYRVCMEAEIPSAGLSFRFGCHCGTPISLGDRKSSKYSDLHHDCVYRDLLK